MALESINPRTVTDDKETIGTIQITATAERQDGKVIRLSNGVLLDNGLHIGNFSQEPNGQFYMNINTREGDVIKNVFAALASFLTNVNAQI